MFSLSDVRLRYIFGALCLIDGYLYMIVIKICADYYMALSFFINNIIIETRAMQLYYFIRVFFLSPIVAYRRASAHSHIGIILLWYRSELSPLSGGSWRSWLFDAEEFPFPNPLHSPTIIFPLLRVDLLARVFFPSKSLYFFFTFPWLNGIIFT